MLFWLLVSERYFFKNKCGSIYVNAFLVELYFACARFLILEFINQVGLHYILASFYSNLNSTHVIDYWPIILC